MTPTNILFTNGECSYNSYMHGHLPNTPCLFIVDPWRTMGLASIEDNSPHRLPTVAIPP